MTPAKLPHRLFSTNSSESFLTALADHGVSLDELLGNFIDSSHHHAILLVGSLSERTGNAASDIDIMVLVETEAALRDADGHLRLDHQRSFEVLHYADGIEFNLKFVVWKDVAHIETLFGTLLAGLGDLANIRSIPFVPAWELRFVHKLRTGWPLAGTDLVEQWNDRLMTPLLVPYLTVRYFNEHEEWLEDARAMLAGHAGAALYAGRMAAEAAMLSLLANLGFTSPSRKWMFHWMEQCAAESLAPMFAEGRSLILGGWEGDEAALILRSAELGAAVRGFIDRDTAVAVALAHLEGMVSYVPADS